MNLHNVLRSLVDYCKHLADRLENPCTTLHNHLSKHKESLIHARTYRSSVQTGINNDINKKCDPASNKHYNNSTCTHYDATTTSNNIIYKSSSDEHDDNAYCPSNNRS